jgi:hypothetical protein
MINTLLIYQFLLLFWFKVESSMFKVRKMPGSIRLDPLHPPFPRSDGVPVSGSGGSLDHYR